MKISTLRGHAASIVWGYHTAAAIESWTITRRSIAVGKPLEWSLLAIVERASPFELQRRPLLFSVPRQGGFWVWPLLDTPHIDGRVLTARLGPMEQ